MADIGNIQSSQGNITLNAMQEVAKDELVELGAEQINSKRDLVSEQSAEINPFAQKMATKEKPIKAHKNRFQKTQGTSGVKESILPIAKIKDSAEQFQRRNPELKSNVLVLLREQIKDGDTKEEILQKVADFYPDVSLADEALEFLLSTIEGEPNENGEVVKGELFEKLTEAKEELNEGRGREIAAGKNIGAIAREAAMKGLGTTGSLRDMYRDITGNPRDSSTLFQELSQKYQFKELKKVIDFLLHSLGADMKSKGPSIPRGLLHRLFSETRSLQAILGVYRFFKGRMRLVEKQYREQNMEMPGELDFESMAREFMALAAERYPSPAKVMQLASKLGIETSIQAEIIVFSQMRDAVREVAMNLIYKSLQHRDDMYLAILEALEDLEDKLEDMEADVD